MPFGPVTFLILSAVAQDASTCVRCHEKEARREGQGVHAGGVSGCVDCHGGDASKEDKDASHGDSLAAFTARPAIPGRCGTCHSDVRRMNPSGLPVDQLRQYETSRHGVAVAAGNLDAAVCTDCHGAHGIRSAKDPEAPVHPANVAATCGRCHADRELMEKTGHPHDSEAAWRDSVHAKLLYEKHDLSAPTCATCHGNHGAAPPGFAEVRHVCGRCHVPQKEAFRKSAHAFYAEDGGFRGCVACHGNHRIVTEPAEIHTRCGDCHDPGDEEMEKSAALVDLLEGVRGRFAAGAERLRGLERAGFHTDREQLILDEARTSLLQLPDALHQLKEEPLREGVESTDAILGRLGERMNGMEAGERRKKLALIPVWSFLGLMAILFWVRHRQLERRAKVPSGEAGK